MKVIGIDLGTTGICGIVMDAKDGSVVSSVTLNSDAFIETDKLYEKIQDTKKIISIAKNILDGFLDEFKDVCAIGITGQMHGILYVDENGEAVSPLYTWQDGRGGLLYRDGKTYSEYLGIPSGYGNLTHFYNQENGLVPESAKTYCTIHDYLAMTLSGKREPIVHVSDAASFGLFDIDSLQFKIPYLPRVTSDFEIIGKYRGIPVSVAIGDNQASVFGTLESESDLLVNIGTGSQVSVITDSPVYAEGIEVRPYVGGKYLAVGAALCGGRAYSLLAKAVDEILKAAGNEEIGAYSVMEKLLIGKEDTTLTVDTRFDGTRSDPSLRGSISGISVENFTAKDIILGVVKGIISELYDMYKAMGKTVSGIVGSGNGIRKNSAMVKEAERVFNGKIKVPEYCEEAACGAAFFAMVATGLVKSPADIGKLIRYKEK